MTTNSFSFDSFGLAQPLRRSLHAENYLKPTPIQVQAIPPVMQGKDLLGIAQTGTGKTAAFALPILHRFATLRQAHLPKRPRALILAPTRELVCQIDERIRAYGCGLGLRSTVVLGGVGQRQQVKALAAGVDILIATPGRLLDLHQQRHLILSEVSILVLDEADRMLDMGFIHDARKIIAACGKKRQTLLFSATMPSEIARLASEILSNPVRVDAAPAEIVADRIDQRVHLVPTQGKRALLTELLSDAALERVLVFTRTKRGADRVCRMLLQAGVAAEALHGNKGQNARVRALEAFRNGGVRVLVATDIAARGVDVAGISHVINYELPNEPESYVHRIGRTARAGAGGVAIAFCDPSERVHLAAIERLMRLQVPVVGHRAAANSPSGPQWQGSARSEVKPSQKPWRHRSERHGVKASSKSGRQAQSQRPHHHWRSADPKGAAASQEI
jgi:ATP-dependent RNA helicase RhlE